MPPIEHVRESRDSRAHTRPRMRTHAISQGYYRGSCPATKDPPRPILRGIPATRPNVGVVSDDRRDKLRTWSDRSHRHSWPDAPPEKFIKTLAEWIFVSRERQRVAIIKLILFLTLVKKIHVKNEKEKKWKRKIQNISHKETNDVQYSICVNSHVFLAANKSVFADVIVIVEWKLAR